jgi:hypothetical protein
VRVSGAGDMGLTAHETSQLREALQTSVVKCSERCLYQAAKWYETSFPLDRSRTVVLKLTGRLNS